MPLKKLESILSKEVADIKERGSLKGEETVVTQIIPAKGDRGLRYLVEGYGNKEFIRMNSNSYLGLSLRKDMVAAEEHATKSFGTGPGAVRFISGTYKGAC